MEQPPPDLPSTVDGNHRGAFKPAPVWVRLIAGAADAIVAGLLALVVIVVILIPYVYPETQSLIYDYADKSQGSIIEDTELARKFIEMPVMQQMLYTSQVVLYSIFFLYYVVNEWFTKGSSLGKKIFGITTVRLNPEEPLAVTTLLLRAWLKTVFLLFMPLLWLTFVWAFFQKEKRAVHDLITGTRVID